MAVDSPTRLPPATTALIGVLAAVIELSLTSTLVRIRHKVLMIRGTPASGGYAAVNHQKLAMPADYVIRDARKYPARHRRYR
jgi:hypothetical protein